LFRLALACGSGFGGRFCEELPGFFEINFQPSRRKAAGALSVSFKKPWNYLAEMSAEARREAPSEAG